MKIIVDADACPVIDEIIASTNKEIMLIRSVDHFSLRDYPAHVHVQYVDAGHDSADYAIVQSSKPGDIVVTQDYGLAALLLPKDVIVIHHNGRQYTLDTIDMMLEQRHMNQQLRNSGQRTKGPKKFTAQDRMYFKSAFQKLVESQI